MTDNLIDRAKEAVDGYTDEDIAENEYLSFARALIAADELADRLELARDADWEAATDSEVEDAFMAAYEALARFRAMRKGENE